MLTVPELTPQVLYIEPVVHPEYLCRAVHTDGIIYCRKTSEKWIDETLVYLYSSSIKVKRQNVKMIHNIDRQQRIVIDEKFQFVLFPLAGCKDKKTLFVTFRKLIVCIL